MIKGREWVTYKLVPDRSLENKNTERLADALYSALYYPLYKRVELSNGHIDYTQKAIVVWEILIEKDNIEFFISVPKQWGELAQHELAVCWEKAAVRPAQNALVFQEAEAAGGVIALGHHYFLSLSTDRRSLAPLPAVLETSRTMRKGDKAIIQIVLDPAPEDWHCGAQDALKKFQSGEMPQRIEVTPRRVMEAVARTGAAVGMGIINTVAEFITEKETESQTKIQPSDRLQLARQGLSAATLGKTRGNAFDVTIRVLAGSPDPTRRQTMVRGIATGFRSVNGDNELVFKPARDVEKLIQAVASRTLNIKINSDYLNTAEVAKLLQLPPLSLQEDYPIENIIHREMELPQALLTPGISLGDVTRKCVSRPVYWPVTNYDELCLPRVVVGSMGCGKSLGYGAGFAADALRKGFSVFLIDVSDGDMANMVRDTFPQNLPADHLIDLDFGNTNYPIYLNWSEVARTRCRSSEIANIMANQLTGYLSKFGDEAGDRTERYTRAATKAIFASDPEASLLEVVLFLCSDEYRRQVIGSIQDPRLVDMWQDFDTMSEGLKGQIVGPILNRLDNLMGNQYVANCLFQRPKKYDGAIDFRRWADGDRRGPYCVILRVPKSILWETATDAIVTFLIAKIWLAILTRIDLPTQNRNPAFLIMDEPHQYLSNAKGGVRSTWGSMITESRKWRLGLVYMFHDFCQLSRELAQLLKSAGPHYTLYNSSKATFQDLGEEIAPFTVEEALNLKTHSAINVVRANGTAYKFIAKMAPPPRARCEHKIREGRTFGCSRTFGRPVDEVEMDIYQREKILYKKNDKSKKG